MGKSYKELSRTEWTTEINSVDRVAAGCLQRIADATEAMALNHVRLQADLEYYKKLYAGKLERIATMEKQIAAYKGHINRLKKQSQQTINIIPPEFPNDRIG